jgi:dihydrofolate reductase
MGKIVSSTYMSLDGDIENMQAWHFEYFGDEATRTAERLLGAADALLMGRLTYEGFAEAWTGRAGQDDFADRMNAIPKYVVSTTLQDPTWNNTTVLSGDVVTEIRKVKERTEGNILQYGFGDVSRLLVANGLLDELVIWLHPVLSGEATPDQLLYDDMPQARLTLAGTDVHSTGIVVLTYVPTT